MLARLLAMVFKAVESASKPVSGIKKLAMLRLLSDETDYYRLTTGPKVCATRRAAGFVAGMERLPDIEDVATGADSATGDVEATDALDDVATSLLVPDPPDVTSFLG